MPGRSFFHASPALRLGSEKGAELGSLQPGPCCINCVSRKLPLCIETYKGGRCTRAFLILHVVRAYVFKLCRVRRGGIVRHDPGMHLTPLKYCLSRGLASRYSDHVPLAAELIRSSFTVAVHDSDKGAADLGAATHGVNNGKTLLETVRWEW